MPMQRQSYVLNAAASSVYYTYTVISAFAIRYFLIRLRISLFVVLFGCMDSVFPLSFLTHKPPRLGMTCNHLAVALYCVCRANMVLTLHHSFYAQLLSHADLLASYASCLSFARPADAQPTHGSCGNVFIFITGRSRFPARPSPFPSLPLPAGLVPSKALGFCFYVILYICIVFFILLFVILCFHVFLYYR